MNLTLKKLTNECYNTDLDFYYKRIGNYKIKRDRFCIRHFYYNHEICTVFIYSRKQFKVDFCGYENHTLTTAQINYLRNFYKNKGYEEI